jgi:hypothetical protein
MGAQNCRTPSPGPNSPCELFSHSLPSVSMPAGQTLNQCFPNVFSSTGKRWRGGTSCCDQVQVRIQPTLPTAISAVIGQFFPQMLTGEVEHRNISRYYPAPVTADHKVNQMPRWCFSEFHLSLAAWLFVGLMQLVEDGFFICENCRRRDQYHQHSSEARLWF